jgi:hypothetical protein
MNGKEELSGRLQQKLGQTTEDLRNLIAKLLSALSLDELVAEGTVKNTRFTCSPFIRGGFMRTIAAPKSCSFTNSVKFIAAVVCLTVLLVACHKPEEKSESAIESGANANQDLKKATREVRPAWQEAWLMFKRENDTDIAENELRIIELRKQVGKANTRFRASYNARIDELERRNNELRNRIDNYRDEGDAKWVAFKNGSKRDMDNLKSLLKKTTIKNS